MYLVCWDCNRFCLWEWFGEDFIEKVIFELGLRGYIKVCEAEERGQHSGEGAVRSNVNTGLFSESWTVEYGAIKKWLKHWRLLVDGQWLILCMEK